MGHHGSSLARGVHKLDSAPNGNPLTTPRTALGYQTPLCSRATSALPEPNQIVVRADPLTSAYPVTNSGIPGTRKSETIEVHGYYQHGNGHSAARWLTSFQDGLLHSKCRRVLIRTGCVGADAPILYSSFGLHCLIASLPIFPMEEHLAHKAHTSTYTERDAGFPTMNGEIKMHPFKANLPIRATLLKVGLVHRSGDGLLFGKGACAVASGRISGAAGVEAKLQPSSLLVRRLCQYVPIMPLFSWIARGFYGSDGLGPQEHLRFGVRSRRDVQLCGMVA